MVSNSPGSSALNAPASADEWLTPRRFAAILAVLILATFPDVVLGQSTFFYRDFGIFGYPLASYHRESFWRGEASKDASITFTWKMNRPAFKPARPIPA